MISTVVAAPLVAALLPAFLPRGEVRRLVRIALAIAAALLPLTLLGHLDGLALTFTALISLLGCLAVMFSTAPGMFVRLTGDIVGDPHAAPAWSRVSIYFGLLGAFWSAMLLVVTASTFTLVWLGISATTLATAFLVAFSGEALALEAAWKYLVLCSVGLAFALLGILTLAHVTLAAGLPPGTSLDWSAIAVAHPGVTSALPRLAIGLMLVGFATKAGLVPMHAWLPDAHSKAPAPISALLSGVLVSCALYALLRTLNVAAALGAGVFAREIVMCLGVLSIMVSASLMLVQTDVKRQLAYSTVEHAGIVALALSFGTPLGTFAAVFHVVTHGTAKAAAFLAVGLVQQETGTTTIGELHGLWRRSLAGRILLGAFAGLSGLPPFGICISELTVIVAGVLAGFWLPLALAIVGIGLAFSALARTAIALESGPPVPRLAAPPAGRHVASATAAALALGSSLASALLPLWSAFAR